MTVACERVDSVLASAVHTRIGLAVVDVVAARIAAPAGVADTREFVGSITTGTVLARARCALVDVLVAVCSGPARLARASVLVHAVVTCPVLARIRVAVVDVIPTCAAGVTGVAGADVERRAIGRGAVAVVTARPFGAGIDGGLAQFASVCRCALARARQRAARAGRDTRAAILAVQSTLCHRKRAWAPTRTQRRQQTTHNQPTSQPASHDKRSSKHSKHARRQWN